MDINNIQKQHTAGAQSLGFDYQSYYFILLALELKQGQKIGFEVKDDIHIDKEDGTTILFQAKHTIQENQNLTTLDADLWKPLSNWTDFIKADKTSDFLKKHSFVLVANKNDGNNEFVDVLSDFRINENIDTVLSKLEELKGKTKDKTITKYIGNVVSLGKSKRKQFFAKLTIETADSIIEKIKNKINEKTYQPDLVDPIFNKLYSNIQQAKYFDIRNTKKFEFTYEDFTKRFGKCFRDAFEKTSLPKRNVPILLPENPEDQIFIKQLLDIGDIQSGSTDIQKYTTLMLEAFNQFSYWINDNIVLPTDMNEFEANSILIWENKFRSQYRQIERNITNGTPLIALENHIKDLGVQLVDFLREQDLSTQAFQFLEREYSNGYFYMLSNDLRIGWHYDWKNKYTKK
jgi:hypothetical protein